MFFKDHSDGTTVVGIGSRNYGYGHVAYDLPVQDVVYKKIAYVPWKFLKSGDSRWANSYLFRPMTSVHLYHLWNGISFNRQPWLTSFEAHLPRYCGIPRDWLYRLCLDRLHRAECRGLLALSDFARRFFLIQNRGLIDEPAIKAKLTVFYGAVAPQEERIRRHWRLLEEPTEAFRLCMVGHDFFRKGGVAVLRAFRQLIKRFPKSKLVVVSRVVGNDYVTGATAQECAVVRGSLSRHEAIEWYQQMPHNQVLDLMAKCHIALLPTLDDTLGWSVLEAMSVGLPVITTNVCAMQEMAGNGCNGYQINVPISENRRWAGLMTPEASPERRCALEEAYERISQGLIERITEIFQHPGQLQDMGIRATEHVQRVHSPSKQAATLKEIYSRALEGCCPRDR
jgi:glycosyltransferase involved in cell wall biosynthesis